MGTSGNIKRCLMPVYLERLWKSFLAPIKFEGRVLLLCVLRPSNLEVTAERWMYPTSPAGFQEQQQQYHHYSSVFSASFSALPHHDWRPRDRVGVFLDHDSGH